MHLTIEAYEAQASRWPDSGRHILAQFDEDSVIVYQAYSPAIGQFAAAEGWFGGEFSYRRMSWIKPSFLWMMFRSGWGTKANQEITLAVRLRRDFFEQLLELAVPSTFVPQLYEAREDWQSAVESSEVRLQWDPDHDPYGARLERRAIQLGLRGDVLRGYGLDAILNVTDVSEFVAEQRQEVESRNLDRLQTPSESVFVPRSVEARRRVGLDEAPKGTA